MALLPNMLTTSSIFFSSFALVYTITSPQDMSFHIAFWLILCAVIADFLDGRVARMLNSQSEFGAQFDSLADMISFGFVPAILCFLQLQSYGVLEFGQDNSKLLYVFNWLVCTMYTVATGFRLARFNTENKNGARYFSASPVLQQPYL